MKRYIHTILTIGLSLTLSAMAAGQDSRVTKPRPTAQPTKHPDVVKPKVILPVVPEPKGKSTAPEPKPFLGGFAGNSGGGFGFGGGFAGNLGGDSLSGGGYSIQGGATGLGALGGNGGGMQGGNGGFGLTGGSPYGNHGRAPSGGAKRPSEKKPINPNDAMLGTWIVEVPVPDYIQELLGDGVKTTFCQYTFHKGQRVERIPWDPSTGKPLPDSEPTPGTYEFGKKNNNLLRLAGAVVSDGTVILPFEEWYQLHMEFDLGDEKPKAYDWRVDSGAETAKYYVTKWENGQITMKQRK